MRPSSIPIPRNIQFRVETLYSGNKRVGRIKPDEHGIYHGLPMMVLGEVTRNRTYYEPRSVIDQISNPEHKFCQIVKTNMATGEWGHPSFIGMSDSDKITRLVTVDERNTSHLFTALYSDNPSTEGTVVVRGDIKPTGPMGAYLKESLDDPVVNTAFSLRAYVSTDLGSDGIKRRVVRQLVTFDTVGASGYANTDKAHAIGLESFSGDDYLDYEVNVMQDGNIMIDQIALESYTDTDLNEIFGSTKVSKLAQSRTFVKVDPELHEKFPNLYKNGIFNEYFKEV